MDLNLSKIFVKVIQNGSFSRAAEQLRIPKSTVSKAVTKLEQETGTSLLLRTTRSLTLTPAGKIFYDTCIGPIQTLEDAQKSLHGQDSILSGTIRITAPEDLGNEVIAPTIGKLIKTHSALNFEINYTDEVVDLIKDGFDLAIRIGKLAESGLKSKKIGEVTLIHVASPEYLRKHQKIQNPQDLSKHNCMFINVRSSSVEWTLRSENKHEKIKVQPRIISNQMSSLIRAASAGAGVAFVPCFLCKRELESGELVRVLPNWSSGGVRVSLLSPLSLSSSVRLKLVSDLLIKEIQQALSL
ncbi:MAG: LysR family transcriptional regulator [Oligoflexia bacterium]|nr:LysR family transcriptional regulator [Oligoflexia bacterium]